MTRLSQCMIVKNEEENIEKALSWAKSIAFEQIVVDTGSSDRTVEIAKRLGAKVFHFQWKDDFSAAKNYAIAQAAGDWIAFLDADEYLNVEDTKKLYSILQKLDQRKDIDLVRGKWIQLDDNGKILAVSSQDRVFRNRPDLRYVYRVHEILQDTNGKNLSHYDAQEQLCIWHTGYAQTTYQKKQKAVRNIVLLKKSLQEYPDSGMLLSYLGDAYLADGHSSEASNCYQRILWDKTINIEDPQAYRNAAFHTLQNMCNECQPGDDSEIYRLCDELNKRGWGDHPDIDYYLGSWNLKCGQYEKAALLLESSLQKLDQYRGRDLIRVAGDLERVMFWIASICMEKTGNLQKGVQYTVSLLRMDRFSKEGGKLLLWAFSQEAGSKETIDSYIQFLKKLYDFGDPKQVLFLYECALLVNFSQMAEYLYFQLPKQIQERLKSSAP